MAQDFRGRCFLDGSLTHRQARRRATSPVLGAKLPLRIGRGAVAASGWRPVGGVIVRSLIACCAAGNHDLAFREEWPNLGAHEKMVVWPYVHGMF
jgi:hypothetical protein